MPTFQRADESVGQLASTVMMRHADHHPIVNAKVTIDWVFAFADFDEKGRQLNYALTKNGCRAVAITSIHNLKLRALGLCDAEVAIDHGYWERCNEEEKMAIIDHECRHLQLVTNRAGDVERDDLHRPKLKLRPHDLEFGFFNDVAARNGAWSVERQTAKQMFEQAGQYYWPEIYALVNA